MSKLFVPITVTKASIILALLVCHLTESCVDHQQLQKQQQKQQQQKHDQKLYQQHDKMDRIIVQANYPEQRQPKMSRTTIRIQRLNQQQQQDREQETIQDILQNKQRTSMKSITTSSVPTTNNSIVAIKDDSIVEMKKKLQPRNLMTTYNTINTRTVVRPHEFLHLHHMKTAGTSIDHLIDCGRKRLEDTYNYTIHYANIHECDTDVYDACVNRGFYNNIPDEDNDVGVHCRKRVAHAGVMSYCAPLQDLSTSFQWNNTSVSSVTVLRHPISRVWSMYRFKTKDCYDCKSLKQIYEEMDNPQQVATTKSAADDDDNTTMDVTDPLCNKQLTNQMIRNILQSNLDELLETKSHNEIINEAIMNMKSFFTMVGITEQLSLTVQIIGHVFPWLNKTIDDSTQQCTLQHANASPTNNKCGTNDTHMNIPDHPDDETTQLIIQHNQLDIALYDAAVQQFELQKRALDL